VIVISPFAPPQVGSVDATPEIVGPAILLIVSVLVAGQPFPSSTTTS